MNADHLSALRAAVKGPVLTAGDPDFESEASGYNAAVTHRPEVIVGATSAADVEAAVDWATEHQQAVAVQATGHGATERMSDGVLINTARMQSVEIDADHRTARIGAGVKWRAVLGQSVPLGLAGLCGSSSDVGVVGFTLGGGLPILGRAFGFAADRVRAIEIVTPGERLRTVDADHEPDLFHALRGGKGNFGVVTAMEFDLLELPEFYGGGLMYPGADADAVLTAFRSWLGDLPEKACPSIALLRLPDMAFIPEPIRGQFVVHLRFALAGSKEEGDALLAPMREVSTVIMDTAGPISYEHIDLVNMDPAEPLPYEEGGALLADFDEAAQAALLQVAGPDAQTPLLLVEVRPLGGALARSTAGPDAVGGRDAKFNLLSIGMLVPPIADAVPAAIADLLDTMRPFATGYTLVNFHGHAGDATDRARAWPPDIYEFISKVKQRYDPNGLMRFGHALILPSLEPAESAGPL